jgi:two-component system sensor histidine kinase BaeS
MRPAQCGPLWRRGARPRWWPENEPWPPAGPGVVWQHARRRFLLRALAGLATVVAMAAGSSAALLWAAARLVGTAPPRGWAGLGAASLALACVLAGVVLGGLGIRRAVTRVGDLIVALGRIAGGDYGVRVREAGPPELRTLGRAFNTMAARLERQDAGRRALLTDISHELRTPLAVLQGNLEGMLDGVYPRDPAHLSLVLEETQVLGRLIEDLRTLTLSESFELTLARAPTSLVAVARDAVASFEPQAAAAGVTLRLIGGDAEPPLADVDPERIRQVLNNLLANALRHTPRGGAVSVRCAPDGTDRVAVSVHDTGRGIAAADLPHVFERFYKGPDSRGAGLGLAIAKSLVEAHGGAIAAESPPDGGTIVRFTLPAAPGGDDRLNARERP